MLYFPSLLAQALMSTQAVSRTEQSCYAGKIQDMVQEFLVQNLGILAHDSKHANAILGILELTPGMAANMPMAGAITASPNM
jgi:hypothetical protein